MIDAILPQAVTAVEARDDSPRTVLLPAEESIIAAAVDKRRKEFTTGRACARLALARLGVPPVPITTGARGEPQWPLGLVGSITHCDGYRACAVARSQEIMTVGIDAEPNAPLPTSVLSDIVQPEELMHMHALERAMPRIYWDRLIFSAKESVYKAWYPIAQRWLGFEDAIIAVERSGSFSIHLLVAEPEVTVRLISGSCGRWMVRDNLIFTTVTRRCI